MRLASILMLCPLICLAQDIGRPTAPAAHPNFSGTWTLNLALSDFPGNEHPISPENQHRIFDHPPYRETDQIDHDEPVLAISPRIFGRDVVFTLSCRTDGLPPQGPNASRQTPCYAHWEGAKYVFETGTPADSGIAGRTTSLSLSDDGNRMTKYVRSVSGGTTKQETYVFDKVSNARGSVALGDTIERVKHQWGNPEKSITEGTQTILVYGDMAEIFISGKLIDGVGGNGIGNQLPVYPTDIAIGQTKNQVTKAYGQPERSAQQDGKEFGFYKFVTVAYSKDKLIYISATGQTKNDVVAVFGQPEKTVEWKGKQFVFYPFMTAVYFSDRLITILPGAY